MPSNINFYNRVNDLTFSHSESGDLDSSAYGYGGSTIAALGNERPYLWFNRNDDITDGKTFTFTITFKLGSLEYTIFISLTGTALSSNFSITVSAKDQYGQTGTTNAIDSVSTTSFGMYIGLIDGQSLNFELIVHRFLNGTYDDVDIILSPSGQSDNQNILLPDYKTLYEVPLLDVWGEGRLTCDGIITGFTDSYNLNKRAIPSSCNEDPIPNLIKVDSYTPVFPLDDNSVKYITIMGSPLVSEVAKEMYRVLDKASGVVILYDIDEAGVAAFEANMGRLEYKPDDPLDRPFNQIKLHNPGYRIYGFPGVHDKDEL